MPQTHDSPTVRDRAKSILRDAVEYGLEYGAEDGVEDALSLGGRRGVETALESAAINGVEEALGDLLSQEFHRQPKKKKSRPILFFAKIAVIAVVVIWIFFQLKSAGAEFLRYQWSFHWGWLILSAVCYLAAYFPAAFYWYRLLRIMGEKPTLFHALRAYYFSQLGKYIPGKAMVVIIRSGMIASEQVRISIAAVGVFYETLTMMASGALLSAVIFLLKFHTSVREIFTASILFLLCVMPLIPNVFIFLIKLFKLEQKNSGLLNRIRLHYWRNLLTGFLLMGVLWLFFGLSLYAAICGVGLLPGDFLANLPRFISAAALTVLLGFAVPIPIDGFRSQETFLTILLIPYFETILRDWPAVQNGMSPARLALLISLARELVAICSELLMAAIFFLLSFLKNLNIKEDKKE